VLSGFGDEVGGGGEEGGAEVGRHGAWILFLTCVFLVCIRPQ
jgi:hypothetical protein